MAPQLCGVPWDITKLVQGWLRKDYPNAGLMLAPVKGKRNDDVAAALFISPQTVQTHVRNLLGKLRVHSKLEAVALAVRHDAISV